MKMILVSTLILSLLFCGCSKEETPVFSSGSSSGISVASSESSRAESSVSKIIPEYSLSSNCVPDRYVSSKSSDSSYVHSTDSSSHENPADDIQYFKGRVVKKLPDRGSSPNASPGNEEVLKRWYFAVADVSNISELRVQHHTAYERELSFDETFAIIENLRSVSPNLKPNTDNSVTDSISVAAFDSAENEIWRVTISGCWFILSFGGENASYVFGMENQDYSAISATVNYVISSN